MGTSPQLSLLLIKELNPNAKSFSGDEYVNIDSPLASTGIIYTKILVYVCKKSLMLVNHLCCINFIINTVKTVIWEIWLHFKRTISDDFFFLEFMIIVSGFFFKRNLKKSIYLIYPSILPLFFHWRPHWDLKKSLSLEEI